MGVEEIPKAGPEKIEDEFLIQKIREELLELGVLECPQEIIDRQLLIEKNSKFNNDSRMIVEGFKRVLEAIKTLPALKDRLSEKHFREGLLAAYLHDIGKSGAAEADEAGQLAVIKLFSANKYAYPIDPQKTISEAVRECFPEEYDQMMANLAKSGLTGDMSVRMDFYDEHAQWTHDILEKYPEVFSERTRLVAASHHIDRHVNPYHIPEDEVPDEALLIGALEHYVDILEEEILMVVDNYQAAISRAQATHDKAMEFLRAKFAKRCQTDPAMNLILDTIDNLGRRDTLFPETKTKYLSLRQAA